MDANDDAGANMKPEKNGLVEKSENEAILPTKTLVNDDETEAYEEAIELQGFHDSREHFEDLFSADSLLAATSATETSASSSSSDDEQEPIVGKPNDVTAYIEYPVRTSIRPRIASFDPTTTSTDSWNEDEKKKRALVLTKFAKPKQPPLRRTGVLELARIEHEKRMEIMSQEWAIKKRLLDMKLRTQEMKFEANRWRAEYFELATKRRFYFNHCQESEHGQHYNDHGADYNMNNGHA